MAFADSGRPAPTRDYLNPLVVTSGADPRAKPVAARTGNWMCLAGPDGQARARRAADTRRGTVSGVRQTK